MKNALTVAAAGILTAGATAGMAAISAQCGGASWSQLLSIGASAFGTAIAGAVFHLYQEKPAAKDSPPAN